MAFKDNLFYLRGKANMSQGELADACGVSRQLIVGFEAGTRNANQVIIGKLAKVLNCTPNDLILGFEKETETHASDS